MSTDKPTPNNEQNLQKSYAQEVTPDTRRKPNPPGSSVWILTATLYHRTSTPNYRNNKRNFRKKTVLLWGVPRHHTSV
jgi:hypothetical protein